MFTYSTLTLIILGVLLSSAVKVLREYERAVVFRLGRAIGTKGPGLIFLIPIVDKMVRIPLRTVAMDVPPQDVITRDNVTVKVNAVIYFRVLDANRAVLEVENYLYATSQIAQTTLRSILGESDLDQLLSNRDEINLKLQQVIDRHTEPWGIKVSTVEVKNVDLPQEMQRAIARQAEAERERRAKVINAEGELQASQKLFEAARVIAQEPIALSFAISRPWPRSRPRTTRRRSSRSRSISSSRSSRLGTPRWPRDPVRESTPVRRRHPGRRSGVRRRHPRRTARAEGGADRGPSRAGPASTGATSRPRRFSRRPRCFCSAAAPGSSACGWPRRRSTSRPRRTARSVVRKNLMGTEAL